MITISSLIYLFFLIFLCLLIFGTIGYIFYCGETNKDLSRGDFVFFIISTIFIIPSIIYIVLAAQYHKTSYTYDTISNNVSSIEIMSISKNNIDTYKVNISDEDFIALNPDTCKIKISLDDERKISYSFDEFMELVKYDEAINIGYYESYENCAKVETFGFLNVVDKDINFKNKMVLPKETFDRIYDTFVTTRTIQIQ